MIIDRKPSFADAEDRKASIADVEEDQSNLLENITEFDDKSRPRSKEDKDKKEVLKKVHMLIMRVHN